MPAVNHNFLVERGADVVWTISGTDDVGSVIDHTGYTVELVVKNDFNSSTNLLSLSTSNAISINGAGSIVITLAGSDTAAYTFTKGVYNLKVTDLSSKANYYLTGQFIVRPTTV